MQYKVGKQELQHSLVGSPYFGIEQIICQSRDFPTELCCNTIIHHLFHYFLLHRSPLHFKFNFKQPD